MWFQIVQSRLKQLSDGQENHFLTISLDSPERFSLSCFCNGSQGSDIRKATCRHVGPIIKVTSGQEEPPDGLVREAKRQKDKLSEDHVGKSPP